MIKVCMLGLGRTGKEVARILYAQEDIEIVSVVCSCGSVKIGQDLGIIIGTERTGILISGCNELRAVLEETKPDVVVDFSSKENTVQSIGVISELGINMVIANTGFLETELTQIKNTVINHMNGIVYAPNITVGVNVLMLMSNIAANILSNYDFHVNDVHYKQKKDAPSGTAYKISKEIEKGLKMSGDSKTNKIGMSSLRVGGVIGKHEVFIVGENDQLKIVHESISRNAFAEGTLRAVRFIHHKVGYYEMSDVLNLSKVLKDYIDQQYTTV